MIFETPSLIYNFTKPLSLVKKSINSDKMRKNYKLK